MINKNIALYKNIIYYEKLNNLYIYNKNNLLINKLVISLKLPSEIKYSNGFITMLVLVEKYTNNLPMFLKDINTLSKNRSIKIGLTMSLNGELMEKYMQLCMYHSIPKINKDEITFSVVMKNNNIFYNTNIILSNTIFSFDSEIFKYYNYLNKLPYCFEFIFYTNTKDLLTNKLILSQYNMNIIIEDIEVNTQTLIVTENNVMLEFGDEEYIDENEIEEDLEDIEYLDIFKNNEIYNNTNEDINDNHLENDIEDNIELEYNTDGSIDNNTIKNVKTEEKDQFILDYVLNFK